MISVSISYVHAQDNVLQGVRNGPSYIIFSANVLHSKRSSSNIPLSPVHSCSPNISGTWGRAGSRYLMRVKVAVSLHRSPPISWECLRSQATHTTENVHFCHVPISGWSRNMWLLFHLRHHIFKKTSITIFCISSMPINKPYQVFYAHFQYFSKTFS